MIEAKYKNISIIFDDYLLLETDKSYYITKGVNQSIFEMPKKDDLQFNASGIYPISNLIRIEFKKIIKNIMKYMI